MWNTLNFAHHWVMKPAKLTKLLSCTKLNKIKNCNKIHRYVKCTQTHQALLQEIHSKIDIGTYSIFRILIVWRLTVLYLCILFWNDLLKERNNFSKRVVSMIMMNICTRTSFFLDFWNIRYFQYDIVLF